MIQAKQMTLKQQEEANPEKALFDEHDIGAWPDRNWVYRPERVTPHECYPFHGTSEVKEGKLKGATSTDYF